MSLEHILERIVADAKAEAAGIEAKGDEDAQRILADADVEAGEIRERIVAKARREAEERAARIMTLARLEARNSRLAAKQEAIEEAFCAALQRLRALPPEQYRDFLLSQVLAAASQGSEELILAPEDRDRFGPGLVAEANEALRRAGRPASLKLADETRPIAGGVILRRGEVEVNCTFETALRLVHDDLVPAVARCLFGDSVNGS